MALEGLERYAEAEASYRKAIELRPDLWSSHNYLGAFLTSRSASRGGGRVRAGTRAGAGQRARAQQPRRRSTTAGPARRRREDLDAGLATAAVAHAVANLAALQFSNRPLRARPRARSRRRRAPGTRDYRPWRNLGAALYWAPGERPRRRPTPTARRGQLAEEERRLDPTNPRLLAHLADCYAMLGEAEKARVLAAEAVRLAPDNRRVASIVAGVYEQLGDRDRRLRWLDGRGRRGLPARRRRERIRRSRHFVRTRAGRRSARATIARRSRRRRAMSRGRRRSVRRS